MSFDWTDVADAVSYQIQVDDTSAFGEPFLILDQPVGQSQFTTSALPDSPWFWFWRVRAINSAGGPGPWSAVRMINVDTTPPPPPPPVPSAPSLVSPANGAQLTTQPVNFNWTDVQGAAWYQIDVDDESTFAAPLIWEQTATPSELLINLPDGVVFWRVRAFNSAGVGGPYSAVRTATVGATTPPPTTTATVPPPATTTTSPPPPTTTTVPPSGSLPAPTLLSPASDARFAPGQTVTFDWSDVTGAASYTIQIDTSETFSAPFTVDQAVSISRHTASGLPTTRMWWRVRANSNSGAPGAWSTARRFELKS